MSLDATLQKAVTSIPECVAAGFVDLASGMVLSIKTVDSHPSEVFELLAAATADLFQARTCRPSKRCSARPVACRK